ncbi:cysteine-rich secretory protein LCCL domain-containing 2 isoform X1 [Oryctolagus cuniculus]|uniref:cysteine-rich secretory protein LCCL domain-containing 2 isoform X1 n=1 Tax=Oryctolagus cuniculus TaxID=9986 RepID=UPI002230C000|nr:cysteine-rich secretory protein LCCL domain-containing 2 [Oryctolagus cuniculus]
MRRVPPGVLPLGLVLLAWGAQGLFLPNATHWEQLLAKYRQDAPHARARRAISRADREEILMLHNKLRGQVQPAASNMEYMTWDEELERSAASWAQQCLWEHGPSSLLVFVGQNLAVHWGRYRSPAMHVQAWYDEVKDFIFPQPHECSPWCPERCLGPTCAHYTQVVWATTNKMGCAVNTCRRMDVWGSIWENAVYLVCNYSPKGNWIGEAPYKAGPPCSACPPSYGGGCWNNLCYKGSFPGFGRQTLQLPKYAHRPYVPRRLFPSHGHDCGPLQGQVAEETQDRQPETDETNEVETASIPGERYVWEQPRVTRPMKPERTAAGSYMTQVIQCDTKMKDRCQGSTCNRYHCPAGCLHDKTKIFGSLFYESSSSICRAALHHGVLNDTGGLVDVTRNGRKPFFVKSQKHGVESLSKYKPSGSFLVSKVKVQDLDCHTTVAQLCPFEKPMSHCPRVRCPARCRDEPSSSARVIGTNIYADSSGICRAAVHAGAVVDELGGYVDVMPVDKKKSYAGSLRNGVQSESLSAPGDGKAFRIFAVRQ